LLRDIRWGVSWGLWIATGFSIIVIALAGFRGSTDYPKLGLTTPGIVAIYYALAVVGGSVLGLLRPFTRSKFGGFIVGSVIGTLVYGAAGLAIKGADLLMVPVAFILGIAIGGTFGYQSVKTKGWRRDAA
jgi:hypothetical protein